MLRYGLIFLFFLFPIFGWAQTPAPSYYWIKLTDKKGTAFEISRPETFLSQRALDRRARQHIPIDETDLPVSKVYLDSLQKRGFEIIHTSKWLNGVTVKTADTAQIRKVRSLPFVGSVEITKPGVILKSAQSKFTEPKNTYDPINYGESISQLIQLNGQYLHKAGYRGKGVQIAVLDAGFWHVNEIAAFDTLRQKNRILASRDLVNPKSDFYQQHTHGMSVLSSMGGNLPGKLLGTAPDASYFLIRTEDASSEYRVEEDNWIAGAELADSLGADIINSSLGYSTFDDSQMNHTFADMTGNKTRVTQGANTAFQKGILVVASAGNEATNSWKRIISPADGQNILAVAAVDKSGVRALFSSLGPAYGGAVKPNIAAMGWGTYLITSAGIPGNSSGTSFSSPVLAGMAACLLQANPYANAKQLKTAIEQSAHQFSKPDSLIGYGIPDFEKADKYLKINFSPNLQIASEFLVWPNPFTSQIHVRAKNSDAHKQCTIGLFNVQGIRVWQQKFENAENILIKDMHFNQKGIFILKIQSGETTEQVKLIRN